MAQKAQKPQTGKQTIPVKRWQSAVAAWTKRAYSGIVAMLVGIVLLTLLNLSLNSLLGPLPSPGLIYLPLVAMLAYHWGWRHTLVAFVLELACIYYFFLPPEKSFKALSGQNIAQLVTITAVTLFVLAIVQLARQRRAIAEQRAAHLSALNRVGTALSGELNESRLLKLIAETARNVTGAGFAAFTLRPLNEHGQPVGPSEGNHFHLAAVVGVTREQERLFRRMPLGGEGLLAPIFRFGVPVRVADALTMTHGSARLAHGDIPAIADEMQPPRENAREAALYYAQGLTSRDDLRTLGVPRGHPVVRSFLGAPLLDREGRVRGGLLLGHTEPNRFTPSDEALLVGLATQAAVALENARLYHEARMQARELDTIFESIADGISLIDGQGKVLRENHTARQLRESVEQTPTGAASLETLLHEPAERALQGNAESGIPVTLPDAQHESRDYLVSAAPLRLPESSSGPLARQEPSGENEGTAGTAATVVVWHDVTEARRLIMEQRAHAETKARRALLQTVIDELPGSIYLVRGHEARLVLANRATEEVWGAQWETGLPMSEFLARNGIRILRPDGRPLPLNDLATIRTLQTGVSVRHFQETIRHADGTTLPVLANAVSLDPRVPGLASADEQEHDMEPAAIVVHQDVTALKEAERIKDDFIGIAAHELRNPLAALKGFAQILTRVPQPIGGSGEAGTSAELNEWQQEAVEAIDLATNRLVELTDDLLDVTRLQAGRLELHTEPTDLVALVRRVVGRLRVTTTIHTFTIDAVPEYIVADVDRQRIEQVITNLLNNAIKYSPDGGLITITACVQPSGHEALLSIQDHGIGIPREQQNRVFGRFVRADNARLREIKGTGLGLYLSRELIERHDGRIWFDSAEEQGSTFYVSLPLYCDEETV